jgi:rhodanese-related sulfurtransferase
LEWRVDPDSPWRNPHVGGLDRHLILVCDHGYSSSLAAVTLLQLGFARATDLIGGFVAWRAQGCRQHRAAPSFESDIPAG